MWEQTLDITGIILKVISMAEKINPEDGNIIIVLTSEEYETLRKGCKVRSILDKLEAAGGK